MDNKKEMTLQEKYDIAINTLRKIANRQPDSREGCTNEWAEAETFYKVKDKAIRTLEYLNEEI